MAFSTGQTHLEEALLLCSSKPLSVSPFPFLVPPFLFLSPPLPFPLSFLRPFPFFLYPSKGSTGNELDCAPFVGGDAFAKSEENKRKPKQAQTNLFKI